jgi:superfamily I DNA/RNA helicase
MAFAKVFNDLRLHFSPKLKAEPKIADSAHHEGALHWIETNDKAQLAQIQEMKDNADTCVITQEKFKEEAKKILGITQVFTAEEIKGLEYKTVILYKILDNEKIYQINSLLSPKNKALLPEAQNSSAELSACFVAATRPTETLYFIHDAKQHNLSAIIQKLKETVTTLDPSQPLKAPESTHTSTADEWAARANEI